MAKRNHGGPNERWYVIVGVDESQRAPFSLAELRSRRGRGPLAVFKLLRGCSSKTSHVGNHRHCRSSGHDSPGDAGQREGGAD